LPDEETVGASLFDIADRIFSRSRDPIVQNARELLGELLAGEANAATAHRLRQVIADRAQAAQRQVNAGYAEHPPRPPGYIPPPPPAAPPKIQEDPREVLGFPPDKPLTKSEIKARQKELARVFHPDRGGSVRSMQRVNDAAAALLAQIP